MNSTTRKIFLTLFYSGLSKKAPGTVGSFVALILAIVLLNFFSISNIFLASILITILAIKQIDIYESETQQHDGKEIVIDELAGMWITISIAGVTTSHDYILFALSFVLFRVFDILKPSIVGRIDRDVKGGLGVMGDDVAAGVLAGLSVSLIVKIFIYFY